MSTPYFQDQTFISIAAYKDPKFVVFGEFTTITANNLVYNNVALCDLILQECIPMGNGKCYMYSVCNSERFTGWCRNNWSCVPTRLLLYLKF